MLTMAAPRFIFMFYYSLISLSGLLEFCSTSADRYELNLNESITIGETLVSANQRFELGFFEPSDRNNKSYLGIWYKKDPDVVAWVANRENPLIDSAGTLTIGPDGKLIILNSTNNIIWSSDSSSTASRNLLVQLLDSGNLVLKLNGSGTSSETESYLWQSFDYPGDTLLPGMKIGWNWVTGLGKKLTSWKDSDDPSPGDFDYGMDLLGLPQLVLRQVSEKKFRTGVWNGVRFSGIYKSIPTNAVFNYIYANNSDEIYFFYAFTNNTIVTRLTLNHSGILQRYAINAGSSEWGLVYVTPSDFCDHYQACGANGFCKINNSPNCQCLNGFVPKSESEWNVFDWSSGCVRRTPLNCQKGDGFLEIKNAKLPDLLAYQFGLNESMSLKECERECLKNCSCTAYATSDIGGRGGGCLIWIGDLVDVKELYVASGSEQNFYIRLAASELEHDMNKKTVVMLAVISAVSGMLFLIFVIWCRIQTLKRRRERNKEDIDLPLFDLATIVSATNNFSSTNMIGGGGFGSVYKGKLSTGQEIAVKRLSKDSGQGAQEFKNEIILISKLQHRNLVKIVGCCVEGKEKLLVYEYMPNESLDYFIFDWKRTVLNWQNRFEIAMGIAKGLAYLHHDSRLRIIHRDLKASNVLLDNELNPKISDFGIARIFGGDQNEAKTKIVIGTYGYMSPEYVIDGKFSTKSDVFSYGVLLLEIVSGIKNTKFRNPEQYHSLLGHAWVLWKEGKALEIMDGCLGDSYVESQVERCIQISLLCVQRLPKDRPSMSSVISMLGNERLALPEPEQPGFFIEKCFIQSRTTTECTCGNQLTVTIPEPR